MIPKIKVLHRSYEVKPFDPHDIATNGHYGRTHHREQIIYLDMNAASTELADTLLHEVMHAVINCMGINAGGDQDEENVVNSLSHGLTTVFHDNPKLLDEIKGLLK